MPAAYTGAFLWGITAAVFSTVTLTTLQRAVPAAVHGRVMGVTAAVDSLVETVGLPLGGLTLAGLGIRAGATALAGVAILAGLTVALTRAVPSPSDPVPEE